MQPFIVLHNQNIPDFYFLRRLYFKKFMLSVKLEVLVLYLLVREILNNKCKKDSPLEIKSN